jgi:cytochrome c556
MADAVGEVKAAGQESTQVGRDAAKLAEDRAQSDAQADKLRADEAQASANRLASLQATQKKAYDESVAKTLIGGGVGKAFSLGAKAVGATEALSPVLQKLGSTGTAIAKGAFGGAAYGAAGGAGEALSKGEDVLPAAAESATTGAVLGGALGGVAHKVGEAFEGAIGKQNESIVRGALERALPRKQSALAALVEEELPKDAKSALTAGDVIQENRKILGGLRSGDYETVSKASDDVSRKVSSLELGKADTIAQALAEVDASPPPSS